MCLAVPGLIIKLNELDAIDRSAEVDFGGIQRTISLACVPEATVGDYVIAHAGVALQIIDEAEANKIIQELALMRDGED
ncbi:MAG: hypothetical protein RJB66_473 [Pseudomonadota bacterium]|jgi:hydrogenase expression/formation protein HypC